MALYFATYCNLLTALDKRTNYTLKNAKITTSTSPPIGS